MRYNQPETDEEALEVLARYEKAIAGIDRQLQRIRELDRSGHELLTHDPELEYGEVGSKGYARQSIGWSSEPSPSGPHHAPGETFTLHLSPDAPSTATSWIDKALDQLRFMLKDKGAQYAAHGEFDNFIEQARMARTSVRQEFRGNLGQKLEREQVQFDNHNDRFDSILDVAGYAVLFLAYEMERRNS